MSSGIYKNRYSINEFIRLGLSFILTKLFFKGAKLVCYPVNIRGKQSFEYGKGFSCGYNCRFDLLNTKEKTLFIGSNCELNDNCHIVATNCVRIGNNFLCASKVFISDTSHGDYSSGNCSPNTVPKERPLVSKPITIGDNVWIGENVVVLPGVSIGDGCIIGANSVVTRSIEKNTIAVGSPAKSIKRYDEKAGVWKKINCS